MNAQARANTISFSSLCLRLARGFMSIHLKEFTGPQWMDSCFLFLCHPLVVAQPLRGNSFTLSFLYSLRNTGPLSYKKIAKELYGPVDF